MPKPVSAPVLRLAEFKPGVRFRSVADRINTGPPPAGDVMHAAFNPVARFLRRRVDYGHLFAYLFRRFGYPNIGWDDYKDLVRYVLATGDDAVLLSIVPYVGDDGPMSITILAREDVANAIEAYQWKDLVAYDTCVLDWIEASGNVPPNIAECNALLSASLNRKVTWRDCFYHLGGYKRDAVGSERHTWSLWHQSMVEQYAAIEARPGILLRSHDFRKWPDEDPLKRVVIAAKPALEDLRRPVRVRDCAINALGRVTPEDYFPDDDDDGDESDPMDGTGAILHEAKAAGYPSGALGNEAPEDFGRLHQLIKGLVPGDLRGGILEAIRLIEEAKIPA